jgi:hypothetical protein
LDLDWNKYEGGVIGVASKDGGVRVWDLRGAGIVRGETRHALAVRKVQYVWKPWIGRELNHY